MKLKGLKMTMQFVRFKKEKTFMRDEGESSSLSLMWLGIKIQMTTKTNLKEVHENEAGALQADQQLLMINTSSCSGIKKGSKQLETACNCLRENQSYELRMLQSFSFISLRSGENFHHRRKSSVKPLSSLHIQAQLERLKKGFQSEAFGTQAFNE